MSEIVLLRHGETEWSRTGRHTGATDLALTARGEQQARSWAPVLARQRFASVVTSPLVRAMRTAELAGMTGAVVDPDLAEWDYGADEGRTTAQITAERPGWSLWRDGSPGGELPGAVGVRADRVLARIRPALADGDVLLVAHRHLLRVLAARWIELPAAEGARLALAAAARCRLGFEHDVPVIVEWNEPCPC